jgi:hypothetical protein
MKLLGKEVPDEIIHHFSACAVPQHDRRVVLQGHRAGPAFKCGSIHSRSYLSSKHYTAAIHERCGDAHA